MVPSMISSMESELCPPDVCFPSTDSAHSSPEWDQCAIAEYEPSNLGEAIEEYKYQSEKSALEAEMEIPQENLEAEGAVGGQLPDLCHTGYDDSVICIKPWLQDSALDETYQCEFDKDESNIKCSYSLESNASDSSNLCKDEVNLQEEFNQCVAQSECNSLPDKTDLHEFIVHNCKHINLVSCGAGEANFEPLHNETTNYQSTCNVKEYSNLCSEYKAFVVVNDLQSCGFDLVRQNLIYSSHPSFYKWECSAIIPSPHLSCLSLQSHGSFLGNDSNPLNFGNLSDRSISNDEAIQITEEEQMKLAKRFGLIQHLPCGIFDGLTKSRECVICMIDFSVGDKVRYLPCMHTYHTDCIDDWLMRSFTCPSCLEPVDAALLNSYETS